MATHQDCWVNTGKNKDGDLQAQEWLSQLNIGDKLLHPPPEIEYHKTLPTGDKFEPVIIKKKEPNYVIISYPSRHSQWDKRLPLKYAFAVRPINSINNNQNNEDDDISNLSQSSTNSNTSDASIVPPNHTIPFPPNNNKNIQNKSSHVSMTFNKNNKKNKKTKQLAVFRDNQKPLINASPTPENTPPASQNTLFNKLHQTRSQYTSHPKIKKTYADYRSKNRRNRKLSETSTKKPGHLQKEEQCKQYQKKRLEIENKLQQQKAKEIAAKKQKLEQEEYNNNPKCNGGSSRYGHNGYNNGYNNYDSDNDIGPMTRSRKNLYMQSQSYESYKNGTIPQWIIPNTYLKEPIGLVNMGNTCFMNSTLQSLIHTTELRQFFLNNNKNKWITDQLNLDNPIGYKGKIAINFSKLIYKMCNESNSNNNSYYSSSVRPSMIHYNLTGVLRQFADYRQHDAQEFMTNFLDALHEDLNRVKKKKYMEIPDFDMYEINEEKKREFLHKRWHEIYLNRNNSICTDLFAGLLKSAVTCPKCDFTAITFDPFMHLLVPLKGKSNMFSNNNSYYNRNKVVLEKCEISFIFLPRNCMDEPEEHTIKIPKKYVSNNNWVVLNAYIYDYLVNISADYTSEFKDDKYRSQMIKSAEFGLNYLYFGKQHIKDMRQYMNETFNIPKCVDNDKIVPFPIFEHFELSEDNKILYLNSIRPENYNSQMSDYIFGKGHRRLIIHELPAHWTDKNRLCMEINEKINCFIVFKKPINENNNNNNKLRDEMDEDVPYEPFNYPRFIFDLGLTGKINDENALNKYLFKTSKDIVTGICGSDMMDEMYLKQQMEIRYTTEEESFELNKLNGYKMVDLNGNNNSNFTPKSVKTMVIIFSFEMQQLYIKYQRNKECDSSVSSGKKRSFEQANMNGNNNENICNNNSNSNPRKKQKLNHIKKENNNNKVNVLPKKFQVKSATASTIEECFGMHLSTEQLGANNKWFCKKCKLHVQGRKKLDLWWLPKHLIIVIKRFENHGLRKCTAHVNYPVNGLDLTELIGGRDSLDIYYKNDNNNKENKNKYKNKKFIYDLYAVINHSGSLNFGHYTATIKYDKKWYSISDSCVSTCSNPITSQAYILCYKQQSN